MSPRPRCSATSESIPPRSIRARTSSPTAASRPTARHPEHASRTRRSPSPTSRGSRSAAPLRQPGQRANAADVHHPRRSAPPRLEADPGRLARRVQPAVDERPDRGRPRARGGRRPHARGADEKPSSRRAMAIATGAGALLALGILAMTVGLIRSESAGDLRTLTATGATPRIRRTLTATTAGALALLAALLGVAGAYVVLGDVLRRPRLPERRAGPLPRPRGHRRATGRRRGRLAARRPRAARHRQDRDRVTGHPLSTLRRLIRGHTGRSRRRRPEQRRVLPRGAC